MFEQEEINKVVEMYFKNLLSTNETERWYDKIKELIEELHDKKNGEKMHGRRNKKSVL